MSDDWPDTWVSECLSCNQHLTVAAVPFSGDVVCPKCGAINVFHDAQKPSNMRGGQGSNTMRQHESR